MTKIKFFKKNNAFVGFECSGHTGYSDAGSDVLCATISGISQSIVLGLKNVCKANVKIKKIEKDGYLKCELPEKIEKDCLSNCQILFGTMYLAIKDLIEGYSKYISMEVIE